MTAIFLLDWAALAVSLFNTILLLWLGMTLLLNAERRAWGVWLAGGGMLMGGLFFVSHTAILGHGPYISRGVNFWWRVGWVPVVASPFAWYVVTLWYAGYWEAPSSPLYRRQRPWFILTVLLGVGLIGLLLFASPLPTFWQVVQLDLSAAPAVAGIPVVLLVYPFFIVLCIVLSIDALRRPGPSARVMGDLARRRARPWLVAAAFALLFVSLLIGGVMAWIVFNARPYGLRVSEVSRLTFIIGAADLFIESIIGVAIVLLGQAVVSYEVFTGKTLPRRGLFRQWRSGVILAAGYGVLVGLALALRLQAIYSLLLTTILMITFYALFNWRSYAERERYIAHLRPFVASQRLYERLLTPSAFPDVDARAPFRALCEDVLETRMAALVALGPLAPLAGPPLVYPEGTAISLPPMEVVAACCNPPQVMCKTLDPERYGGATWMVPLWSERGIIGSLLLGEKRGGGLYTQEEVEIARATSERLIDTLASVQMARRLMALQRQRLAESQVLDRSTRRALHDDVLPGVHAAMLTLEGREGTGEALALLTDAHRRISKLLREMPAATEPALARRGLVGGLRQVCEEEFGSAFDDVTWEVAPRAEREACDVPALMAEVVFYAAREAMRNAARHGRAGDGQQPLHLRVAVDWQAGLEIVIEDDGVGMVVTGQAGEEGGQGLALHSTMMAVIGGALAVESVPGRYTRVRLSLPREAW
jgi:signal transduction histidine kinase